MIKRSHVTPAPPAAVMPFDPVASGRLDTIINFLIFSTAFWNPFPRAFTVKIVDVKRTIYQEMTTKEGLLFFNYVSAEKDRKDIQKWFNYKSNNSMARLSIHYWLIKLFLFYFTYSQHEGLRV